jgi:DNA-binding transcriptional MerR regulator
MSDFIFSEKHTLTVVSLTGASPANYSLETAARLAGVPTEMLRYYCRLGLFGAARARAETEPTFDDDALYELRRIEHYRRRHGVNRRALPLLCELWRELDRLQAELRFLRGP